MDNDKQVIGLDDYIEAKIDSKLGSIEARLDNIHDDVKDISKIAQKVEELQIFTGYIKGGLIVGSTILGWGLVKLAPLLFH